METDGTWAGHMELQAASLVTHSNICIHRVRPAFSSFGLLDSFVYSGILIVYPFWLFIDPFNWSRTFEVIV